jgi:hypothetical protein
MDRLQYIDVKSPTFVPPEDFTFMDLMAEAAVYVKVLPDFVKPLFTREDTDTNTNKFDGMSPSFIIFDVSLRRGNVDLT